jgi:hypothetical protein
MTLPKHWTIVLEVCWDVEDGDDNFAWKTIWGNTMHFMMLEMMSLRLLKLQVNEILSDLDPNSMDYFIPLGWLHISVHITSCITALNLCFYMGVRCWWWY